MPATTDQPIPRTEASALEAAVALEKEIDALADKAASLSLNLNLPQDVKEALAEACRHLRDTIADSCIEWSVRRYEEDEPRRERAAAAYAREVAADVQRGF